MSLRITEINSVKIAFVKGACVPCDRHGHGEYFWIYIEADFPYILDEKRDLPIPFSQKAEKLSLININSISKSKVLGIFLHPHFRYGCFGFMLLFFLLGFRFC